MRYFALLALGLFLNLGIYAQDSRIQQWDELLEILTTEDQAKGSVSIFENGKLLYAKRFDAPTDKETYRYRIGSISKTFTTVLIMQAVEEGKLSLADDLLKWFPQLKYEGITIDLMLSHRSGLHNITSDPAYTQIMEIAQSESDMIARIALSPLDFEPGSKQEYSNTNFILLSYILEKVYNNTGYHLILDQKIIQPLGLKNTYYMAEEKKDQFELESFQYTGKWIPSSITHPSIPMGAGGIISTPEDLNIFMNKLFGGDLISQESLDLMKKKQGMGKGLIYFPFYEDYAYGHNGGIDGFVNHCSFFPERNLSIALCLNGMRYPLNDLLIDFASIALKRSDYKAPSFVVQSIPQKELEQYVGTYKSANFPLDLKIFIEDDQLKAQASGQVAFPLNRIAEHQFEFKAAAIRMTFDPEANTLAFEQAGLKVPFKR